MSILSGLKLLRLFLFVSVCLVSITIPPSKGYCDDNWIFVNRDMMFSYYYDKQSIDIDRISNKINVLVKYIYTDEGKKLFFPNKRIDNQLSSLVFDYNKKQYQQLKSTYCHLSEIIKTNQPEIEWEYIKTGSIHDEVLNKILTDYNIKKTMLSDGWIYVTDDDIFSFYYNNQSIKIDKESNKIEVMVKEKLSEKGKERSKVSDKLSYYLTLNLFDYNKMEFQQLKSSAYFMSGVVKSLDQDNKNIEWTDIKPGDVYDKVFNKILED